MEYFNMNPKFIRIGESSAPAGTVQQLGDILDVGLPPAPKYLKELDNGQYLASLTQVKLLGKRFNEAHDILSYDLLGDAGSDLGSIVGLGLEVSFEELGVAENGVPYLFCSAYEDCGQPFAFILYCDGRTIRAHLPHYGNMLTAPEFEPFSDFTEFSMAKNPVFIQRDGHVSLRHFASDGELYEYIVNSNGDVTYSKEACLKDFSACIKRNGELSREQVESICENVAQKYNM